MGNGMALDGMTSPNERNVLTFSRRREAGHGFSVSERGGLKLLDPAAPLKLLDPAAPTSNSGDATLLAVSLLQCISSVQVLAQLIEGLVPRHQRRLVPVYGVSCCCLETRPGSAWLMATCELAYRSHIVAHLEDTFLAFPRRLVITGFGEYPQIKSGPGSDDCAPLL